EVWCQVRYGIRTEASLLQSPPPSPPLPTPSYSLREGGSTGVRADRGIPSSIPPALSSSPHPFLQPAGGREHWSKGGQRHPFFNPPRPLLLSPPLLTACGREGALEQGRTEASLF
ncbi:unnamed protein product, partial [Closterium sp. NIES-54]